MSRTLRGARLLAAAALASVVTPALVVGFSAPSHAIPDVGAASDTPGTSSTVSPKTLAPGDRITFTVKGFPGGETIYVKIDDGANCADTTQGGCVYHQQKIPSSGTVTGSFTLPPSIAEGQHWLRFLASKEVLDANGEFQGTEGYTLRKGSDFTVAKGGDTAGEAATGAGTTPTAQAANSAPSAAVTQDTATLSLGSAGSSAPAAAATTTAAPMAAAAPPATVVQTVSTPRPIPVIGIIVLGVAIAMAAAALGFVVARGGRRTA